MKIFKYGLPELDNGSFSLNMPKGAKILTAQEQNGTMVMWALVNPENKPEKRNFLSLGTGNPISYSQKRLAYITTVQENEGEYVWHLFELID